MSHSFGILSSWYVSLPDFVHITFFLRKGNSLYAIMIPGLPIQSLFNSKEEIIDHVWQQQRYNCEGTYVIIFIFPGLISCMLLWPHKYLFDGAGSDQGSRTQRDSNIPVA